MSFANPTPLKVGMQGTFSGHRYGVAGRIVMGMEEDGETYYWNEFNLVGTEGQTATLVFEEGESGGEWRMFTLFEPEYPMTVSDAATRRVGDRLNLEGNDVRVTLVDESRVYHIEGEAPEGVEVGDVAQYFNAEAGKYMVVVSWTGDEVEYYRGIDLTSGLVATAFNLQREQLDASSQPGAANLFPSSSLAGGSEMISKRVLQVALGILLVFLGFGGYMSCRSQRQPAPRAKVNAPVAPLTLGSEAELDGRTWRLQDHALVEIALVGRLFDRHEYHLTDAETNRALLVCGLNPDDQEWVLFTLLEPITAPSPVQAAVLRVGERINVDGLMVNVTELFQSVVRQSESIGSPNLMNGAVQFGFLARSNSTVVLARWNAGGIAFHRGRAFSAKVVVEAFNTKPGN